MIEIDTIEAFDAWVARRQAPAPRPGGSEVEMPCAYEPAAVQSLDLSERTAVLSELRCAGSLFLACTIDARASGSLVEHGAVVVPDLPGRAFTVHRARVYAAEELYDVFDPDRPESFADCLDQRIYRQYLADGKSRPTSIAVGLWQGLHDHSISDALWDLLDGHRVVAVMGGHGMERRDPRYRTVVQLAKLLTERGYLMVSGGGPGAMEATHVGAWLAGRPDSDIDAVLASGFTARPADAKPNTEYADEDWLVRAWRVRERWPRVSDAISVGIPTWLYGHEPPTPFATHIAKYFANSIREDGVLAVATHGVVFAPGSAGTMQEIFQDACQNHYGTMGLISPMVLLDSDYWTHTKPVWPLLDAVSSERRYGELVALVDTCDEVASRIQAFEPSWYGVSSDPAETLQTEMRHALQLRSNWTFETVDLADLPAEREWIGLADVARLSNWLYAVGGDDWVDRTVAVAFFIRQLEDGLQAALVEAPTTRRMVSKTVLVTRFGTNEVGWRAVLAD